MTTGGHNLQRSFALLLADNIEQIFVAFIPSRRLGERRRKRCLPRKKCANLLQMVGDQTIAAADQADLRRIVRGDDNAAAGFDGLHCAGDRPGTPRNPPVRASSPTNSY